MATLYERLGGEAAISSVVDNFYVYMLADEITASFFANTDMAKQRQSQKAFITLVTGGPNNYHGTDMKKAHNKFKITKVAFDKTWSNLYKSLNDHKVPQNLIDELKEVFYSVESDVVNA
jgi:hemoglobin